MGLNEDDRLPVFVYRDIASQECLSDYSRAFTPFQLFDGTLGLATYQRGTAPQKRTKQNRQIKGKDIEIFVKVPESPVGMFHWRRYSRIEL